MKKANGLVWSGQLSGSDQTLAETGPEGRKLERSRAILRSG